jgi:hypothetical protein
MNSQRMCLKGFSYSTMKMFSKKVFSKSKNQPSAVWGICAPPKIDSFFKYPKHTWPQARGGSSPPKKIAPPPQWGK